MISLFTIFESILLILNAGAILNEQRVLKKCKYILIINILDGLDKPSFSGENVSSF